MVLAKHTTHAFPLLCIVYTAAAMIKVCTPRTRRYPTHCRRREPLMGGLEFKRLIRSSGLELTPAQSSYLRQICSDPSGQVGTLDLCNVWRLSCATCAPPLPTSSQTLALSFFCLGSHGTSHGSRSIPRDRMSHGMPRDPLRRPVGPLSDPFPHLTKG